MTFSAAKRCWSIPTAQYGVLNVLCYAAIFNTGLIPFTFKGMALIGNISFACNSSCCSLF